MRKSSPFRKEVLMFDLQGTFIKKFESVSDAGKELNVSRLSIAACARGKFNTAFGYKWSYTGILTEPKKILSKKLTKKERVKVIMTEGVKKRISETNKLRWTSERREKASLTNFKNKPILQYDLDMNYIQEFRNVSEAVKAVGATTHTNIAKCARGKCQYSCGYKWKYKE
jgi:hypothetical protein